MKSLSDLLKKKNIAPKNLDDQTVFFVFRKVIKEEFGNAGIEKFRPDFFGRGVLSVKAESSVWANELWMNKGKILRMINKELGGEGVNKLKVKN